ncbi:MAG: GGDEF domain-containing protein [Actinobacteria bacterium]|nr:GGDEF domain-containing protein [Actinomycetota bacterium]
MSDRPGREADRTTWDFQPPRRNPLLVQLGDVALSPTPETWVVQARRLIPFALLWLVAICLPVVLPGSVARPGWLAASGLLALVTGLGVLFTPQTGGYREWRIVPVITVCLAVVMLTYGSGSTSRGYGQVLVLLPVIWQGVYGRRRDTVAAVVVAGLALVAPMVVFEGYPVEVELPRVVVLVLVCAVVGAVLQSLMRSLRANDQVLIHLSRVVRDLYAADDPRTMLCEVVASLAGAPAAVLAEERDGELVVTAAVGYDRPAGGARLTLERVGARGRALDTGTIAFEPEVAPDRLLTGSRLHVPIATHDARSALVTAVWPTVQPELPSIVLGALALVGADAGVALERIDLVARLAEQARRDGLTGLPNRREWDEVLAREIARAQRSGRPLALAVLDLDRFKDFNDRHGHLAGDDLLRAAAQAWRASLRAPDVIARWGGEEFAVLFPDSTAEEAVLVLRRLRMVTPDGQSFSAGVVQWEPGEEPEALVAAADALMYEAKAQGRDHVRHRPAAG